MNKNKVKHFQKKKNTPHTPSYPAFCHTHVENLSKGPKTALKSFKNILQDKS